MTWKKSVGFNKNQQLPTAQTKIEKDIGGKQENEGNSRKREGNKIKTQSSSWRYFHKILLSKMFNYF